MNTATQELLSRLRAGAEASQLRYVGVSLDDFRALQLSFGTRIEFAPARRAHPSGFFADAAHGPFVICRIENAELWDTSAFEPVEGEPHVYRFVEKSEAKQ